MKTKPIADKTLWDSCGNRCRVEMHMLSTDVFEVYFHDFNLSIPRRIVGRLGICNAQVDLWIALKKEAGFVEQLPSYNPEAWRA